MTEEKIGRINHLAKKAKTEGLSDAEKQEQASLRAEYIADYRKNFTGILDHTYLRHPNGKTEKLKRKP